MGNDSDSKDEMINEEATENVSETEEAENDTEEEITEEATDETVKELTEESAPADKADSSTQEQKKAPAKKKRVPILLIILIVLVVLVLGGVIAWKVMNASGKNALYNKAESSAPTLENIQTEDVEIENDVTWQKGWVRYNGDVYQYNEDILTFLIMGVDKKGEVETVESGIDGGQADLIMLAVCDPHEKSTSIIAINRNTMTEIDVYDDDGNFLGSGIGQLCLQHGYGDGAEQSCERTEKAVSNLFYNLPIHGYISVNMGAIKAINSAVGGVTVTLGEEFKTKKVTIPKGKQTLTDDQAYAYIKYRDVTVFDSASERLDRQKKYIAAFLSKLKAETSKDITVPMKVFNQLSPYIVTDITTNEMTYMVSNMYNYQFDLDNIYSLKGTTEIGKTEHEEFYYDKDQLYDMIIDIFYEKVDSTQAK